MTAVAEGQETVHSKWDEEGGKEQLPCNSLPLRVLWVLSPSTVLVTGLSSTSQQRQPPGSLGSGPFPASTVRLSLSRDRLCAGNPPEALTHRHDLKGKSGANISDILMQTAAVGSPKLTRA